MVSTIEWKEGKVYMLDQRKLPFEELVVEHSSYLEVAESIKNMVIRGAPAIGVAAAMGIALGVNEISNSEKDPGKRFKKITSILGDARPTAVNLFWAISEMEKVFDTCGSDVVLLKKRVLNKALEIRDNDETINKAIGDTGKSVINNGDTILTHCNAGSLATAGYGTALGVIRSAHSEGKKTLLLQAKQGLFCRVRG